MQDIRSILESLHAIEADLVHTNDEADLVHTNDSVVSLQAPSDVPAHLAGAVIWDVIFNNYREENAPLIKKSAWRTTPTWVQAKSFLKCYEDQYQPKTDEAIAQTKKGDDAIDVLKTLIHTQSQHKQNVEATRQSLLAWYQKTKLIDPDGGVDAWNTLVDYNANFTVEMSKFENSKRDFMHDVEILRRQIENCKQILRDNTDLCTTLHNWDSSRLQLFKTITTEAADLNVEKQKLAVQHYGDPLIQKATNFLSDAHVREQVSDKRSKEISAQKKSLSKLDTTIVDIKYIKTVSKEIEEALKEVTILQGRLKKESPPEPATSPPEPATSDLIKKNDELQVLQHALVEQLVVLAQDALQQEHAQHAASSILAEQTLQADHAKVEMEQQHLEEAQEKVADVQQEMCDTMAAMAEISPPPGTVTKLFNDLVGVFGLRTEKVVVAQQEVVVAQSVLAADVAAQAQQRLQEFNDAQTLSAKCKSTALVALTQAKQDIKLDAAALRLVDVSSVFELEHEEAEVMKKSIDTYKSARQVFLDAQLAQSALFVKVYPDKTPPALDDTDLPDSLEVWTEECRQQARAAQTQAKTEDNTAHAAVAAAQNTLANDMQHLQALVDILPADAPGPDQASVSPQQQYDALAQAARNLIEDAENTLKQWLEILDKCAGSKAQADYYEACVAGLLAIKKKYASSPTNKYTDMLEEQLRENEGKNVHNHAVYIETIRNFTDGEHILNNAITIANNEIDLVAAFAKQHPSIQNTTLQRHVQKQPDALKLFGAKTVDKRNIIDNMSGLEFTKLLATIEAGLGTPQAPEVPEAAAPPAAVDATDALSAVLAQYEAALLEFQKNMQIYIQTDIVVRWFTQKGTEWESQLKRVTDEAGKCDKNKTTYTERQELIRILTNVIEKNKRDYSETSKNNTSVVYKKLNADHLALQQAISTVNSTINKLIANDSADTDKVRELEARLIPTRLILSEQVFEKRKLEQQELENGGSVFQQTQLHVASYTKEIAAAEAKIADADNDQHDRIGLYNKYATAANLAIAAAFERKKELLPLCNRYAQLRADEIREHAFCVFFGKPTGDVDKKTAILAFCTDALTKTKKDLPAAKKEAERAAVALQEATAAAHDAIRLARDSAYTTPTYQNWVNAQVPEPFDFQLQIEARIHEIDKLRKTRYDHSNPQVDEAVNKLNSKTTELTSFMERSITADELYTAAVNENKDKKAAYDKDKSDLHQAALDKTTRAVEDAHYARTTAVTQEEAEINIWTELKNVALEQASKCLPYTTAPVDFEKTWTRVERIKVLDPATKRLEVTKLHEEDAILKKRLAHRTQLVTKVSPLFTQYNASIKKVNDTLTIISDRFHVLLKTKKPVPAQQVHSYNTARRAFDELIEKLRLDVDLSNEALIAWFGIAGEIVKCMGESHDDNIKRTWKQIMHGKAALVARDLLDEKRIRTALILDVQQEPPMQAAPAHTIVPAAQPRVEPPQVDPSTPAWNDLQDVSWDSLLSRVDRLKHTQHDKQDNRRHNFDNRPNNDDPHFPHSLPPPPPACSFKQSFLAFAARLLALVYPPVPAQAWLDRLPVARYEHPDRARAGSLELHALCARVAHIALLVNLGNTLEPLAAHRFLVELPEHARLLVLAVSALPAATLYAARAAPSREHPNAASIRACLSGASLAPLRACAAQTVAAVVEKESDDKLFNQASQQYV